MVTNYIKTYSGERFYYLSPELNNYNFDEIAHCLCKEQRFGNHLVQSWSVGQYSLFVHKLMGLHLDNLKKDYSELERNLILKWSIHHDDLEAYFKDIPTPLKDLLPEYKRIYQLHEDYYAENILNIGMFARQSVEFKSIDNLAMYFEDVLIGSKAINPWHDYTLSKLIEMEKKLYNGEIMRYIQKLMLMNEKHVKEQLLNWYNYYE